MKQLKFRHGVIYYNNKKLTLTPESIKALEIQLEVKNLFYEINYNGFWQELKQELKATYQAKDDVFVLLGGKSILKILDQKLIKIRSL